MRNPAIRLGKRGSFVIVLLTLVWLVGLMWSQAAADGTNSQPPYTPKDSCAAADSTFVGDGSSVSTYDFVELLIDILIGA